LLQAELAKTLSPGSTLPDDPSLILAFARRLRDSMEVFLKCFVSLRDGYQEFETEVLRRERYDQQNNRVGAAKDDKELGIALLGPEASRQLHEVFVEVMTHQVALMNGVMEGVKQLLAKLAPATLEDEYERKGKKGGLFSNKYEALWKLYETRHADYSGEDTETFLIIFGPQFAGAYAKTTGEALQTSGDAPSAALGRFAASPNQIRR
jgi:type VI secretion system protein ImpI